MIKNSGQFLRTSTKKGKKSSPQKLFYYLTPNGVRLFSEVPFAINI
jgi:hypothetical protein